MTKDEVLKLAKVWFEANTYGDEAVEVYEAIEQALAQPAPVQEPVYWNVIDPTGNIVASEKNAIRGWARVEGYKPTVEGLLGFHDQGWRVLPAPQRTWVGLTDEERNTITRHHAYVDNIIRATEAKLKEKNNV